MRIRGLSKVFTEPSTEIDADKKADAFAELIQCLDDTSLSLIIRDARDDGGKALNILRRHYLPSGKPRIITLYTELTSLKMERNENVTDFIIRAETLASQLRDTGEIISDSLLVAMVMKALPEVFKPFVAVINQKDDDLTFSAFKILIRNYEDTEKIQSSSSRSSSVMMMNSTNPSYQRNTNSSHQRNANSSYQRSANSKWCPTCKSKSHDPAECYKKQNRYCSFCRTNSHDTRFCRKKDKPRSSNAKAKSATHQSDDSDDNETYVFKVSTENRPVCVSTNVNSLLVDSGATAHILNDKSKFFNFTKSFNGSKHTVEFADGSRAENIVENIGDAHINLVDSNGRECTATLRNALYIPSFEQEIFFSAGCCRKRSKDHIFKEFCGLIHKWYQI